MTYKNLYNPPIPVFLIFCLSTFSGCAASMMIGDAIRSGKEDYHVAVPPTSKIKGIKGTDKVAINLRGTKGGKYLFYGGGRLIKQFIQIDFS